VLSARKIKMEIISQIERRINDELFITAYEMILSELELNRKTIELIEVSKQLSKAVRSKAYYYASRKADKMDHEMSSLLKLIIKINGEDFYG